MTITHLCNAVLGHSTRPSAHSPVSAGRSAWSPIGIWTSPAPTPTYLARSNSNVDRPTPNGDTAQPDKWAAAMTNYPKPSTLHSQHHRCDNLEGSDTWRAVRAYYPPSVAWAATPVLVAADMLRWPQQLQCYWSNPAGKCM